MTMNEKIAVVGLGYVGLPVALALGRTYPGAVGFDISEARVKELRDGIDRTRESTEEELRASTLRYTSDPAEMAECTAYIVAVPTPIDVDRRPDLRALRSATATVADVLKKGDVVVFESTVYPGATREVCVPILEERSGLRLGDFEVGYSPERINPGDRVHRLETVTKVVSASSEAALGRVAAIYESVVEAGVHRAASIEVAEAAKVIENTQRDLNIALMNELALVFDRLGIRTADVLAAAGTKWNFLPFRPGLVGGHCIGVDPYYLTAKAEAVGYHPDVILAGRRVNDSMGRYVAQRVVKALAAKGRLNGGAKVGLLGITFKEDVPDIRNSRSPDIVAELREFGIEPLVHDPWADAEETLEHYQVELSGEEALRDLDALVVSVAHQQFVADPAALQAMIVEGGALVDVKSMFDPAEVRSDLDYWSL